MSTYFKDDALKYAEEMKQDCSGYIVESDLNKSKFTAPNGKDTWTGTSKGYIVYDKFKDMFGSVAYWEEK